ncbi:MAG TPA: APC family permease [Thermoplasmataceae archaeon]|nr:APC family permease [Thermoplasmatales archaeon AK]HLH85811.1 APC family permease [Thermoplasmataceae archaeon]
MKTGNQEGNRYIGSLKKDVFHILDLVPLSTSSVAPVFSVAAAYGSMALLLGPEALMSVIVSLPLFIFASIIFKKLNMHFPHAGASYYWGTRIIGRKYGILQMWIITLAYFFSLPSIVIPAGGYTLSLLASFSLVSSAVVNNPVMDGLMGIIWVFLAAVPLLCGAKPTAKFTEIFLGIELLLLSVFIIIGVLSLPHVPANHFNIHWYFDPRVNYFSLGLSMVIVATILDGWEIDSYASEESKKPKIWPGTSGIAGLAIVGVLYLVTMTILNLEVPFHSLEGSLDSLYLWASYITPKYAWLMDVAIISSTASSLWLTAFILTRAWYAGARDHIMPSPFGWLHRKFKTPWFSILILTLSELIVLAMEMLSKSVLSFFTAVLSAAGAFLLCEFILDSVSSTYLFWFYHRPMGLEPKEVHTHWGMRVISPITSIGMSAVLVLALVSNRSLMQVFIVGLLIGVIYVFFGNRRLEHLSRIEEINTT